MVDAQGNRIVSFKWLIGSGLSSIAIVVGIMTWILSMFFADLKERFADVDEQLKSRVHIMAFQAEKMRNDELRTEIKSQVAHKVDIDRYQSEYGRVCEDLKTIISGQANIMKVVNDVEKTQQRVIQKLDLR